MKQNRKATINIHQIRKGEEGCCEILALVISEYYAHMHICTQSLVYN